MFAVARVDFRAAPTPLSIELAESLNITMVGFARGKCMNIYSHAWRIETAQLFQLRRPAHALGAEHREDCPGSYYVKEPLLHASGSFTVSSD